MKKLLYLLPVLAILFVACEKEENTTEGNGQENTGTSGSSGNTDNSDSISIPVGEAVDLGLSVKWANFNVGASEPEGYGLHFAWGETELAEYYDWSIYKYCNGSKTTLTKYCNKSDYGNNGFVDNKTVLDPEDDVAHVKWGGDWRMPTKFEQDELRNEDNCTWTWITINGVNGYKVQSNKSGYTDNWIFLPAAGFYGASDLVAGKFGGYWSSSLSTDFWGPDHACSIYFYSGYVDDKGSSYRYYGLPVRPVCP